jgi:hypothetical protein
MGVSKEHIVRWPKNGIEHYYPPSIIDRIFGAGPTIDIVGDTISRNRISFTKGQLVDNVIGLLQSDTRLHPEFQEMLIERVEKTLGLKARST